MSWYDLAWNQRKPITINGAKIVESGVYPVFIAFASDSDLAKYVQDTGADILFTDEDGETKLPHEIEYFNPITGGLAAWVRVSLTAGVDKTIYMYYHNRSCGSQENPAGVWGSEHVLVQHLEEQTDQPCDDSSQQGNDGTPVGSPTQTEGLCNGCLAFASGKYVEIPDSSSLRLQQLTVLAAVKLNSLPTGEAPVIDKQDWGAKSGYTLFFDGDYLAFRVLDGTTHYTSSCLHSIAAGEWHVLAGTYDGANVKVYIDGALKNSVEASITVYHDATPLRIGKDGWNDALDGLIDEARVMNTVKSEGWLKTVTNNLKDPASFLTVGSHEYSDLWKYPYRGLSLEEAHATWRKT